MGQVKVDGFRIGGKTFVRVEDEIAGQRFEGCGFAVRDEHDEQDEATGELLATGRAYADLASQAKRAGWDRVREQERQRREDAELVALAVQEADREEARHSETHSGELGPPVVGHVVVKIVGDFTGFEEEVRRQAALLERELGPSGAVVLSPERRGPLQSLGDWFFGR